MYKYDYLVSINTEGDMSQINCTYDISKIKNPTYDQCFEAVYLDGGALMMIPSYMHTFSMCEIAVRDDPSVINYVEHDGWRRYLKCRYNLHKSERIPPT